MMSKRSGGPAAGENRPAPVNLDRVRSAARSFGFHYINGDDRVVFPWTNHVLIARIDTEEMATLVFESVLREQLTFSEIATAAQSVNTWNHERLGPTASMSMGNEGEVELRSRSAVLIERGLSDEQVAEHVRLGVETTILMVRELLGEHPGLDGSTKPDVETRRSQQDLAATMGPGSRAPEKRRSAEDNAIDRYLPLAESPDPADPADPAESATFPLMPEGEEDEPVTDWTDLPDDEFAWDDAPTDVTIDRVRNMLAELGITKTTGESEALIAWINGVLFGFFIDNGPSYLIKGHWDPGLDPDSDFLRVFLLCNEWNEENLTTKAYTHADDEGLQVRVEFTVPVAAGLSDAQLEHNTAVAVNHILHALDTISTEVTGVSAVDWPR